MLTVIIPGEPHAQGRGRAHIMHVKGCAWHRTHKCNMNCRGIRVTDPKDSREWKAVAAHFMSVAMNSRSSRSLMDGPLLVEIVARFGCPKSRHLKKGIRAREWKATRPDVENIAKAVLDAAKGIVWHDDAQVAVLLVKKFVGAQGEAPRVEMCVQALSIVRPTEVHLIGRYGE
jgi:Holliday junction resolvase RusA-like endonuclease